MSAEPMDLDHRRPDPDEDRARSRSGTGGTPALARHHGLGRRVVIVGAGRAGLAAAERLRERRFTGELVLVGEELHRPYNRTPLSKQLLTGQLRPADLTLPVYTEIAATWRLGTRAVALEPEHHTVVLPGGERLSYDGLVIATGVEARHLPGAPIHSPRVHMLRTLDDARGIDAALARSRHLAVVGGGFIGGELASTARARGLDVTLIDLSPTLLAHSLGAALGAVIGEVHRDHGVRLHLGVGVTGWHHTRDQVTLELADGETVTADTVVVGVGTTPRVDWLRGAGLDLSDGVLCAATCHVLDAAGDPLVDAVAAGDIARWPATGPDLRPDVGVEIVPRRVEHYINAVEMGRHAADALLAGPSRAEAFTPTPRFWSEQHGVRIQSAGTPLAHGTRMHIAEGTVAARRFLAAHTSTDPDGQTVLRGAVALDAPRALLRYTSHIGQPIDAPPTSTEQVELEEREPEQALAKEIKPEGPGSEHTGSPLTGAPTRSGGARTVAHVVSRAVAGLGRPRPQPALDATPAPPASHVSTPAAAIDSQSGPAAPGRVVRGRIHRRVDATPVPTAVVTLIDTAGRQITRGDVDPDGCYHLLARESGSYLLICAAPDCAPRAVHITLPPSPADDVQLDVALDSSPAAEHDVAVGHSVVPASGASD